MKAAETYEHEGVKVEIHWDDCGEHADPRQHDNLGTMVCWHPDYILGDKQFTNRDGRGDVENPVDNDHYRSMEHLYRCIGILDKGVCIMPLFLYDHSGISMSVGAPNPFDSGPGYGWDTTMVGFVYTTHDRITELCGDGDKYHSEEWILAALRGEVNEYDKYLRGEVFGYVVDPGGPDEESCWGYLGCDSVLEEANMVAANVAKARRGSDRVYVDAAPVEEALAGLI